MPIDPFGNMIQGIQGVQSIQVVQGPQGPQGTQGPQGPQGDSGNMGDLLPIEGGSMSGNITMGHEHTVSHIRDPEEVHEAATKGYVDKMVSQPLKLLWSGNATDNQQIRLNQSPEDFRLIHTTSVHKSQHAFTSTLNTAVLGNEFACWYKYVGCQQILVFYGDRHKFVHINNIVPDGVENLNITLTAVYGEL